MTLCIWSHRFSPSPHQKYHLSISACAQGLSLWIYCGHMGLFLCPDTVPWPLLCVSFTTPEERKRESLPGKQNGKWMTDSAFFHCFHLVSPCRGRKGKEKQTIQADNKDRNKIRLFEENTKTSNCFSFRERLNLNSPWPWIKCTEAC